MQSASPVRWRRCLSNGVLPKGIVSEPSTWDTKLSHVAWLLIVLICYIQFRSSSNSHCFRSAFRTESCTSTGGCSNQLSYVCIFSINTSNTFFFLCKYRELEVTPLYIILYNFKELLLAKLSREHCFVLCRYNDPPITPLFWSSWWRRSRKMCDYRLLKLVSATGIEPVT